MKRRKEEKKAERLTFECFVEEVYKGSFLARMIGPREEDGLQGQEFSAEFSMWKVPKQDRDKVRQPGTIFSLTLETGKKPVFSFPPPWTEEEIRQIREDADRLFEEIKHLFEDR